MNTYKLCCGLILLLSFCLSGCAGFPKYNGKWVASVAQIALTDVAGHINEGVAVKVIYASPDETADIVNSSYNGITLLVDQGFRVHTMLPFTNKIVLIKGQLAHGIPKDSISHRQIAKVNQFDSKLPVLPGEWVIKANAADIYPLQLVR